MNDFITPRRWALAVIFACMALVQNTSAQCNDFQSAPLPSTTPINVNTFLTLMGGTEAEINASLLAAYGILFNPGCTVELATDPAFTMIVSNTFDCSDVLPSPQTFYVRAAGPGGPSANYRQLNISIFDNTPPTIATPPSDFRSTDFGGCTYTIAGSEFDPIGIGTGDNCPNYTLYCDLIGATSGSFTGPAGLTLDGVVLSPGVTSIAWYIEDESGNFVDGAIFDVEVQDNEPPTPDCSFSPIIVFADPTPPLSCGTNVTYDPFTMGTDNCSIATATTDIASGSFFNFGTTTVTVTLTDDAGNSDFCTFDVEVYDDTDPIIAAVADITIMTSTGGATPLNLCDASYTWAHPAASDNCAGTTIEVSIDGGPYIPLPLGSMLFALGTHNIEYLATDASGNTDTEVFIITVIDNQAPAFAIPPTSQNNTFSVTAGDCAKVVTFTRPSYGMPLDCGPVTFTETVMPTSPDLNVLTGAPAFNPLTGGGNVTVQFPAGVTTIRYRWSDNATPNNIFEIFYTFTINEDEAPTAICVPGGTVVLPIGANGSVTLNPAAINNGSTDNCGSITLAVAPATFTCATLGTQSVTLTVADLSPMSPNTTCTTTITVVDNTAPSSLCPNSLSLNTSAGLCTATGFNGGLTFVAPGSTLASGQYTDNCGMPTVTYKLTGFTVQPIATPLASMTTQLFNKGVTTVSYTFADANGNSSVCNFTVTVVDVQKPATANCPNPAPINVNLAGCLALATWTPPTFTDNCPGGLIVTATHNSGAFFFFGTTVVTYTAIDQAGNVGTCTFNVVVNDTQNPVAKCKPFTLVLDGAGMATLSPSDIDDNSTDNCFIDTRTISKTSFTCTPLGVNVVTLTVTDGGGRSSSCTANVTVVDNILPVANCATVTNIDLTSAANGTLVYPATALDAISTDNCSIATREIAMLPNGFATSVTFDCSLLGTRTLVLKVTDSAGNVKTCSKVVTIRDVSAPVLSALTNQTISCNQPIAPTASYLGIPTVLSENCGWVPSATNPGFVDIIAVSPLPNCTNKTIVRTWTVTDNSGNTGTISQQITVQDAKKPVFTLPTVNIDTDLNQCFATYTALLTAANVVDTCSTFGQMTYAYTIQYPAGAGPGFVNNLTFTTVPTATVPFPTYPIGETVIVWRAIDACLNSQTASVKIIVKDTNTPKFTYPKCSPTPVTITLPNTSGSCDQLYSWNRPMISEITDCKLDSVREVVSNSTVQDFINIVTPFNWTSSAGTNVTAQFPVGQTTISYIAKDKQGNTAVCSFIVKIVDTQKPTIICPPNQVLPATCPDAALPSYNNLVQIFDNCPLDVTLTQSPAASTALSAIPGLGVPPAAGNQFTVTMTANDQNPANTKVCTFIVTLADGNAPIPDLAALNDTVSYCGIIVIPAPTAKDLCNPSTPNAIIYGTPSAPVGSLLPGTPPRYELIIPNNLFVQNYVITWVYDDGNGNVSTQVQNITIYRDTFAPDAQCVPTLTLPLSATGMGSVTTAQIDNGSDDPDGCGPISLKLAPNNASLDFTCANLGANMVTLIVTDANGNTATCKTTVTVTDVTLPVFVSVPNDTLIEACNAIPPATILVATDACDNSVAVVLTSISTQDTIGFDKYNYSIVRTWVATDNVGNTAEYTQQIDVEDTTSPVFAANTPTMITQLTDPISTLCGDTVKLNITPFVSDCATGADLAIINDLNPLQLGNLSAVFSLGTHVVHFLAEDISGNTASHSATILVKDGTMPTAVCNNSVSVSLLPSGTVTITPVQINDNSFDNCTPSNLLAFTVQRLDVPGSTPGATVTFSCADANGAISHPVRLVVRDTAGNTSNCIAQVFVQDNVNPVITTCPPSKTIQCTASIAPAVQGTAVATDNCQATVMVTFTDVTTAGVSPVCTVITRTWKAVDVNLNAVTCVQVLSVQDTVKPVFSLLPANITVSCDNASVITPMLTATDNCGIANDTIVPVIDTIGIASGACGLYSYTVRRTWTATDDCGNTSKHTQLVKVEDTTAPTFLGMPDTLTYFSANFAANGACEVPVALNVGQYLFDCSPDTLVQISNDAPFGDGLLSLSGSYPVGEYMVFFAVADVCGNAGTDSLLIRTIDNSVPTVICNDNIVISLGSNGQASLQPVDVDLGSTDNCGIASMALSQSNFDCQDLGINAISLTVTDINGNSNLCNINVNVTLGTNAGFVLVTTGTPETYFGADNGAASTTVTGSVGPFTYVWSTGATTTGLTNLVAGNYFVTVTDLSTGCVRVDTAMVAAGAKITITAPTVTGCQGQMISVPVTADNFINVIGFQFGIQLSNVAVGTITGISNVNPALAPFAPTNPLALFYASPTPKTLANGAVLFNIDILLTAAAIGSNSPIAILSPIFSQDSSGIPIISSITTVNGNVAINCAVPNNNIAGDIATWKVPTIPIPNVQVALTGTVIANQTTLAPGTYTFAVPGAANTTVTPAKSVTSGFSLGINVGDLLAVQTHATPQLNQPLTNPYAFVAGDINNDKNVNLIDYLLIQQLILGTVNHYSNGAPDWKFVPKAYMFPTPNPLSLPVPSNIQHTNVTTNFLDDDFVGVRMGDVTGNAPVNNLINNGGENDDKIKFRITEQSVPAGETVTIPVLAKDFVGFNAYQMTINFDPTKFELTDIQTGSLPGLTVDNFGSSHLSDGHLTALWVNTKSTTLSDNTVLFTLTFKALSAVNSLSEVLHVGSDITSAEAIDENGEILGVDFEFVSNSSVGTDFLEKKSYALYQNQPNPFSNETTIGFRMAEIGKASIRVFSTDGRLVKTIIGNFNQGNNTVVFRKDELGAPGVYYYELETSKFSDRKKMILID